MVPELQCPAVKQIPSACAIGLCCRTKAAGQRDGGRESLVKAGAERGAMQCCNIGGGAAVCRTVRAVVHSIPEPVVSLAELKWIQEIPDFGQRIDRIR